jgi:hypothetical protein
MNTLSSRIVIFAVAALLGASANGRDAQAQTRYVNGLTFAPSGSWQISASASGGQFTPQISYSSLYGGTLTWCCIGSGNNICYFKREDTGQFVTASDSTHGDNITATGALTGFTAVNGQTTRYPISVSPMCAWAGLYPILIHIPGWRAIRPARFTLTVTP